MTDIITKAKAYLEKTKDTTEGEWHIVHEEGEWRIVHEMPCLDSFEKPTNKGMEARSIIEGLVGNVEKVKQLRKNLWAGSNPTEVLDEVIQILEGGDE